MNSEIVETEACMLLVLEFRGSGARNSVAFQARECSYIVTHDLSMPLLKFRNTCVIFVFFKTIELPLQKTLVLK